MLKRSRQLQQTRGWCCCVQLHRGGEDGHRAWKAATAMVEVEKGGTQGRARGRRRNFCAKRIGLAGFEGEQHARWMELVVDSPNVQSEMTAIRVRSAFASNTQPW